jgi:enolase
VQLVGDDLFVTNPPPADGIARGCGQRPARQGEPDRHADRDLDAVHLAHRSGYRCMMSHRSGETETPRSPTSPSPRTAARSRAGAPAASERVAKYNQLLRIEEELDEAAATPARPPSRASPRDEHAVMSSPS